jgi:zinc protease
MRERITQVALFGLAIGAAVSVAPLGCVHKRAEIPRPTLLAPPAGGAPRSDKPSTSLGARPHIESPDIAFWTGRADLIQPPPPPEPVALVLPRVDRWRLGNGLQIVAVPRPGLPIVSFSVAIRAGGYDEDKGRTLGTADFVAAMLRKGTRKRTSDQIADAIDGVGGALNAGAGMESSALDCSVLAQQAALCLDLLAEMLLQPTFPGSEMAEIRDQSLAALAARNDDPHLLAAEHFNNLFYGEEHPDGWVLTDDRVRAIQRVTLWDFWNTYYRPNNATLAVAGDFDVTKMRAAIARAFGRWKPAPIPRRPVFEIPRSTGTRVLLVDKPDLTQTTLMFGHPGAKHDDPDWYALTLMNYVLGGSDFSSRLMTEIRSKRGLTYGIGSSFGGTLYQSAFRISASTRNETASEALMVTVDELRRMKMSGPTADELAKAKGYYAGSIPFELESAAGLAHGIVAAELHGLGLSYVRDLPVRLAAVDLAAARAAARDRLDPDDLSVVMVGRASVIEPQIRAAGLTLERIDYRAPISSAARATPPAP